MGFLSAVKAGLVGRPDPLPEALVAHFPELARMRVRRGGLPLRVGGWFLGRASVAGITLYRTVWLAPGARWDPGLLLHELCHVHQFESDALFPLRYCWASLTRGYRRNPYELDAVAFADRCLRGVGAPAPPSPQDASSWSSTPPPRS